MLEFECVSITISSAGNSFLSSESIEIEADIPRSMMTSVTERQVRLTLAGLMGP